MNNKIFIWETQSIIALDLKCLLRRKGFETRRIAEKEDIVPMISKEKPGVFIVCPDEDYEMGGKLTAIIQCLNIPVIILSAFSKPVLGEQYDFSTIEFISKPFDENELVSCIGDVLCKKFELNKGAEYFWNIQQTKKIAEHSLKYLMLN